MKTVLDSVSRLHAAQDPDATAAAAVSVIRALIGPARGVLLVTQDGNLRKGFGNAEFEALSGPGFQRAEGFVNRAVTAGLPVTDDQTPSGGFAVPLDAGSRRIGGLYVASGDSDRRFGPNELDLLRTGAAQIAIAFDNAFHRRDLALLRPEGEASANEFVHGLSLHDAKLAFERRLIRARLRDSGGNIAAAARVLDMDRGQLSRLLKKHGLDKALYRMANK